MRHSKALARGTALGLVVMTLACGSPKPEPLQELPPELRKTNVVSLVGPAGAVPIPSGYSWMGGTGVLVSDPEMDEAATSKMVNEIVVAGLARRGMHLVGDPENADLLIGYFAALDDDMDDDMISRQLGIENGLEAKPNGDPYPGGSLIIEITSARTHTAYWRGAVQAFVDVKLNETTRRSRLIRGVDALLSRMPTRQTE